ncbi:MAG: phosphotransferase [Syntrophobacterales bacterium]|jgi:aminoglycoside/choline kinase family phosphotransferase|nr:phosphotransferase [Syntrophobacterales bacterium]
MTVRDHLIKFAEETLGEAGSAAMELTLLTARGSDRSFFRLKAETSTYILIRYDPARMENSYYAAITEFLRDIGLPVPRLIRHDPENHLMLMEDMGQADLWSFRHDPWETRETLYKKTLAVVYRLHSFPEKAFPIGRVRLMDEFNPRLYQWERDYFKENFVTGACGIELEQTFADELEMELSALAGRLSATTHCLVHRDFQSQNVMIRDGEPYLIDYQGMRFGSPFYDLGSLLLDPYVSLLEEEIEELLDFYYELSEWNIDRTSFTDLFWDASAERLMQALGAYGFLGIKKGLAPFFAHIPAGIMNLRRAASNASMLPRLRELVDLCRTAWISSHSYTPPLP